MLDSKKYLTEFIGTFFLFLVFTMTTNDKAMLLFAPLSVGAVLAALILSGEKRSGAHYNPVVTIAALMTGKMDRADVPYYFIAQILGAVFAAFIGSYMHQANTGIAIEIHSNQDQFASLLAEFMGSFAWVYVFFSVKSSRAGEVNSHVGLATGFTLMAAMFAFGGLSGGVFNPVVWLGSIVTGANIVNEWWIYLIGQIIGAAAAASLFMVINKTDV